MNLLSKKISLIVPFHKDDIKSLRLLLTNNFYLNRFELILVEWGTTLDTVNYGGKYISVQKETDWTNDYSWLYNIGAKHSSGDYIICANPSMWVDNNWLMQLLSNFNDANITLLGDKVNVRGKLIDSPFVWSIWKRQSWLKSGGMNENMSPYVWCNKLVRIVDKCQHMNGTFMAIKPNFMNKSHLPFWDNLKQNQWVDYFNKSRFFNGKENKYLI